MIITKISKFILIFSLGMTFCTLNSFADDTDQVNIVELKQKANQGDTKAQTALGDLYKQGKGVPQDYAKYIEWYKKANAKLRVEAEASNAEQYFKGKNLPQEYFFAAQSGHVGAQLLLGLLYSKGEGVPKDMAESIRWYTMAAEEGNVYAQVILGIIYEDGEGVPQDYAKALEWYERAAYQRNVDAQILLGNMYRYGKGVPKDSERALVWYNRVADRGSKEIQHMIEVMPTE